MRRALPLAAAALLLTGAATPLAAQLNDIALRADMEYRAENWEGAASAYRQVAELSDAPGAWYRLGRARFELGRLDGAIEALEQALRRGFIPSQGHYLLARAYARAGYEERAVDHLVEAVAAGYLDAASLREEEDFAAIRGSALYAVALERAEDPIAFMDGGDAMDFWVGDWTVLVEGQEAGTNRIEKILGGAAILEHWTGSDGATGKSLFYFVPDSGQWKQVWVVNGASVVKEKLSTGVEGGLRFEGEARYSDGRRVPDRTTLTRMEDGRVRQLIEVSTDGGQTWTATFDAVYVPR